MIDVKEAVAGAVDYVGDLFVGERVLDVRLEEVELSEDDRFWYITLSFVRESKPVSELQKALGEALGRMQREYKMFVIQSADGKVKSMKIRQPV